MFLNIKFLIKNSLLNILFNIHQLKDLWIWNSINFQYYPILLNYSKVNSYFIHLPEPPFYQFLEHFRNLFYLFDFQIMHIVIVSQIVKFCIIQELGQNLWWLMHFSCKLLEKMLSINVYSELKKLNPCKPHFYNNIYYNFHPDQYNI